MLHRYSGDFTDDDIKIKSTHKVKIHPVYKGLRKKKVHPETGHAGPERNGRIALLFP
jgi:hypothetical protein